MVNGLLWAMALLCLNCFVDDEPGTEKPWGAAQEGRKFLTSSFLHQWERCVWDAPQKFGKTAAFQVGVGSDNLVKREFWTKGEFFFETHHSGSVQFGNPRYSAMVLINEQSVSLASFLPDNRHTRSLTKSPILSTGMIHGNSMELIPTQLKRGNLRIEGYRFDDGFHHVKLMPIATADLEALKEIEFIELRFDDRFLPLPDTKIVKTKKFNQCRSAAATK